MNRELEHKLEHRKIKPTAMRLLVLDFFQKQDHAISLKDLENGLESTDRVTLFRTLKTFEEHKIIHASMMAAVRSNMLSVMIHVNVGILKIFTFTFSAKFVTRRSAFLK